MLEVILCVGCGDEIYDFEERISNSTGDWHFDCYIERDDGGEDDD